MNGCVPNSTRRSGKAKARASAAWLTYRLPDGTMSHTVLATATVDAPDQWLIDGEEAPPGWSDVQVIYDERQVRADIAVKRSIVDAYRRADEKADQARSRGRAEGLLYAVYLLASAYADRPDFPEVYRRALQSSHAQVGGKK